MIHFSKACINAIIAMFFCGLITSCAYYPRLTGVPLIEEKGDTRIEGGISFMPPNIQASVSHGVSECIAIQAAGTVNDEDRYGHVAIGYFKKIQDRNVMELYGGFGFGHFEAYQSTTGGRMYGNNQTYFMQFNFGNVERKSRNKEYGVGLKLGYQHYKMTDRHYFGDIEYNPNEPLPVYNINGLFVEPIFFTRFGGEKLKFQAMLGGCLWLQLSHKDKEMPWWPLNFGFGVSYSFGGNNNK